MIHTHYYFGFGDFPAKPVAPHSHSCKLILVKGTVSTGYHSCIDCYINEQAECEKGPFRPCVLVLNIRGFAFLIVDFQFGQTQKIVFHLDRVHELVLRPK